jgi:predicted enzyme related to lactoylglutathione lyase
MQNAINWFELPAANFDRAVDFYSTVLGTPLRKDEFMGVPHGFFPIDEGAVGGAVIKNEEVTPATNGILIYLNVKTPDNLVDVLARVEPCGGKVLLDKTSIGDPGFVGIILDTEGNRVGFHAPKV